MANYGEELAYWYLRLNGFFLIKNFVLHRTTENKHPSDCDVLAIRMPNVWEEIGGKAGDWDMELLNHFSKEVPIGIICQVKTGDDYEQDKLFLPEHLQYVVRRIGFPENEESTFIKEAVDQPNEKWQYSIGKLLVARKDKSARHTQYLFLHLDHIKNFLVKRIEKYPKEKWQDRMFFSSELFQHLIDQNRFTK